MLKANMLQNLGSKYLALVFAIHNKSKKKNKNLFNSIFYVIYCKKLIKKITVGVDKSHKMKLLSIKIHRALKKTCTTLEYVKQGLTRHYNN